MNQISKEYNPYAKFSLVVCEMGDKESDAKKQQPHEMHNSELVSKLMCKLS